MMRTRILDARRYLIGPSLAIAACALANAQCYQFSGPQATLKVNLIGFNLVETPIGVAGGQAANYVFSSSNSFTLGSSTQISTASLDGQINIQYLPSSAPGVPDITTFQVVVPDATPSVAKGSGEHSWEALLTGAGNLLPNGLVAVLPPISSWFVPPPSMVSNYIQVASGSTRTKYDVTSVTSCSPAGSDIDLAKALGDAAYIIGCVSCGDPINLANGNLFERVTDYQTTVPLGFTRYYNSLASSSTYAVRLGANWRSSYDRYLRLSASSVIAERADGQQVTFTLSNGAWSTDTDLDYKLSNTGSTWTLTDPKDHVETYTVINSSEGLLQSIRSRNGYTLTLGYDSGNVLTAVTDSFNLQLNFAYSNGRLATVTTPDGLILTYGYTGTKLTSVSYSTTPATSQTYLYENTALPNALTGIIDENGNRFTTWTYDTAGRALSSQHAGGVDPVKIAYNDTDGSRAVTDPPGAQSVYKFTVLQKVPKVTEIDRLANGAVAAAAVKIAYDANGYIASQTDWNGNLTSLVNDAHGQPTSIVQAAGTSQARTTSITYHSSFHLPVKVVQAGLTTTYSYDANGNLLTKILTDTTTATAPYSTAGQTRAWTYTWSNFLLASVQKPRTDVATVTHYAYDSSGALTSITNALGQTTQFPQHLPGGLPQETIDRNGVTRQFSYDPRLRLLTSAVNTAAGTLTTTFNYDAAGNLLSISRPDGSTIANSFDAAHRLTGVTDLFNQTLAYTLDANGDRTQGNVFDSSGVARRTRTEAFDALGRLQKYTGGAGQTVSFTYDSNGNSVSVTDPLSRLTQRGFDAQNRQISVTDPAKNVTGTAYDSLGRPLSLTDSNGGVTTYTYDGFGDIIRKVSPDSGTTVYRYDPNGNLTQTVKADGAIVNYTYDALDRMTAASYPADAAENIAFSYDESAAGFGVGRMTSLTDVAGTLARTYDERGNVLTESRAIGATTLSTAYSYEAANRLASVTYPSGWMIAYTRDIAGRVTAVTAQSPDGSSSVPILSSVGYEPFGPANSLTFGNGVTETRSYDLDYRLTGITDSGSNPLQSLTYSYDAKDNVTSVGDGVTPANSQKLGYDALDRLAGASGGYGAVGYTYDSVGNRLTQTGGAPAGFAYAAHANQLTSVSANGVTQAVRYTKAGHIAAFDSASGPTAFTYNQAGRLASVTSGNSTAAQYTYDAYGRRLEKVGAVTGTTLYQYDRRNQLLEEADGRGNALVDYVYLGRLPIAAISPADGQVYWLQTDRLGAPRLATDSNQSVAWSTAYGPFGETGANPGLIVQNLRLPGQEFDVDTGLYHNGLRDYVPAWGRYLESDPIGLAGGVNTYGYAGANPATFTDPSGLCEQASGLNNGVRSLGQQTEYWSNFWDQILAPTDFLSRKYGGQEFLPSKYNGYIGLAANIVNFAEDPSWSGAFNTIMSAASQVPGPVGLLASRYQLGTALGSLFMTTIYLAEAHFFFNGDTDALDINLVEGADKVGGFFNSAGNWITDTLHIDSIAIDPGTGTLMPGDDVPVQDTSYSDSEDDF